MTKLIYKTKGNSDPRGKPRLYFSCHPDDFDMTFETVCEDIFRTHDCTIYYKENMADELPEDTRGTDLGSMNLFVFPVTFRFLNEQSKALNDLAFAKKEHRPILPIVFEYDGGKAVLPIYSREEFFGKRQFIAKYSTDFTEISYEDKLKKYLDVTLVDKETAEKIRKAFDAYIFLSYRKKDRKYANELMSLIHSDPVCRDIAIWFDEFLTPGESFEELIEKAMKESKLFTLLITPSLLEKGNYVQREEYPRAVESGLPVLPAEKKKTDRKALAENFKHLPEIVNANDEELFRNAFLEAVKGIARHEKQDDPMHNYLIGLAYLNGTDAEINVEYGVELITKAAEAELPEAMEKLFNMYREGSYVILDYKKALFWAERLYEFYKREKGEEDPDTLVSLSDVAVCHLNLGNYEKAKKLNEKCHKISCKVSGEECFFTIAYLNNLAVAYLNICNYDKAIKLGKKCYETSCKILGREDIYTLKFLNNLAMNNLRICKYDVAIELNNECYELRCKVLGKEHPDTLVSLSNLALSYSHIGKYDIAIELNNECYESKCKVLGKEHPDTLASLNNLAKNYLYIKKYGRSIKLSKECYKSGCKVLGKEHPSTLTFLSNLAMGYSDIDEHDKAMKLNKECHELRYKILGKEHSDTLTSLNNLALSYLNIGRCHQAIKLSEECYKLRCKVSGKENPDTLMSLNNLASCYSKLGNYEKAVELLKQCYKSKCKVLGKEHPDTLTSLHNLASCCSKLGNYEKAVELLEQCYKSMCKVLGKEHPYTRRTLENLEYIRSKLK